MSKERVMQGVRDHAAEIMDEIVWRLRNITVRGGVTRGIEERLRGTFTVQERELLSDIDERLTQLFNNESVDPDG